MRSALEEIALAMEQSAGKTPTEVIAAFLPDTPTACGAKLLPITMGHELFLAKTAHPLATGSPSWEPADIFTALFVLTHPSRELFAMVENGSYVESFHAFLDEHRGGATEEMATEILHHWWARNETSVAMESPHPSTQKKTAGSAGG